MLRILIPGSYRHIGLLALVVLAGSILAIEARTIWVEDPCTIVGVPPSCPLDLGLCPPRQCPLDPLFPPCPSGAPDNPFFTIDQAMSVASFGDTIRVRPGLYCENVVVENGVRLRGSGASDTVIEGDGTDPVLIADLVDTGTVIQGFTITGIAFCGHESGKRSGPLLRRHGRGDHQLSHQDQGRAGCVTYFVVSV